MRLLTYCDLINVSKHFETKNKRCRFHAIIGFFDSWHKMFISKQFVPNRNNLELNVTQSV